jgi:hypothetical protein
MMPAPTEATLTIGRVSDVETIRLRVIDDASSTVALQLELTPEQFALGLTGQANRPAKARWLTANIGRAWETKTEVVPIEGHPTYSEANKNLALAPFEVDGWRGNRGDLGNPHKKLSGGGYRVDFYRFAERYEGERADLEVLHRFAQDCLGNYTEGQPPEIAAVLQAVESFFVGRRGGV